MLGVDGVLCAMVDLECDIRGATGLSLLVSLVDLLSSAVNIKNHAMISVPCIFV